MAQHPDPQVEALSALLQKLANTQEAMVETQQKITENHDILMQNQLHSAESQETVVRNQAIIIRNQDIIVQNQTSIIQNQENLIQNQALLEAMLKLQTVLLNKINKISGNLEDISETEAFTAQVLKKVEQENLKKNLRHPKNIS
jgi:hypothetical protein